MTRRGGERGFVLVTAMVVLMIMLMLGLAVIATVNVQTTQTGHERSGEAAFNLAESALDAEAYQLQLSWPSSAVASCANAATSPAASSGCLALVNNLQSTYTGAAYTSATWSVQVVDDTLGASVYADSMIAPPTGYDHNIDGRVWVRAQAIVGGQKCILVEQVVRQKTLLTVPDNTITAGAVYAENDARASAIDARDSASGLTGAVEVRCDSVPPAPPPTPSQGPGNCLGWDSSKGQLDPPTAYGTGYVDPGGQYQTFSTDRITALVNQAKASHTYYDASMPTNNTCPPAGTAGVVVVANLSCTYQSSDTWNSDASPGILLFLNGSLTLSGSETFYGLIYGANQGGAVPPCIALSAPPVVTVHGNARVHGAVFVDGCGVVAVGESNGNVMFDSNVIHGEYAIQTVPAQNTFRIVPNS